MRIIHLMSARDYVGEAARTVDLAEQQVNAGHQVQMVLRAGYGVVAEARSRGLPVTEVQFASRFSPSGDFRDMLRIRRLFRDFKPDIVHAHRSKEHWLAALLLAGSKTPLVRTRHVTTRIHNHLLNRWLYGHATKGIICASQTVEAEVRGSLTNPPGNLATISGGIDLSRIVSLDGEAGADLLSRLRIPEDAPVILIVARIAKVKGQEYLLEALPEILEQFSRAVVLLAYSRSSHYRPHLENRIRERGTEESIRWLGPQEHIGVALSVAAVSVVASIGSEGWSRVAVESMAAGVPLVATKVGSLPELLEGEQAGLLVEPRDSRGMAQAIKTILGDKAVSQAMAEAGRERAADFSVEHLEVQVAAFYEKLL